MILCITPTLVLSQGVVTDPGSYAYYIQQIGKATEQIQKAQDAIAEMKELNEGISKMSNGLSTAYNNTFGIVGEISNLVETLEKTPEYIEKGIEKVLSMSNCLNDQAVSYGVLENMREARYQTSTPKKSDWNYGSDPAGRGEAIKFGTDLSSGSLKRPCGDHVPNYTDIMNNKLNITHKIIDKLQKFEIDNNSEEAKKAKKEKLEKIKNILNTPNQNIAEMQQHSRDFLAEILLTLKSMENLMYNYANYQITVLGYVPKHSYTLTDEQKENINQLTDEEIYQTPHTNKYLEDVIRTYSNEDNDRFRLIF